MNSRREAGSGNTVKNNPGNLPRYSILRALERTVFPVSRGLSLSLEGDIPAFLEMDYPRFCNAIVNGHRSLPGRRGLFSSVSMVWSQHTIPGAIELFLKVFRTRRPDFPAGINA